MDMKQLLDELQSVDTVKLVLTGVGESVYPSREMYEVIRSFVDKQVPMKPAFDNDDLPICPACKQNGIRQGMFDEIGGLDEYYYRFSYCCNCGQAINWDDVVDQTQEFFRRVRIGKEEAREGNL